MDDPLLMRSVLYFACFCTWHLGIWMLDVLLTSRGHDMLAHAMEGTAGAVCAAAWPVLRRLRIPLLLVVGLKACEWMLNVTTIVGTCTILCGVHAGASLLRDDSLVVASLRKRDLWPCALRLVLFCRVSTQRKRAPREWPSAAASAARCVPWVARTIALARVLGALGFTPDALLAVASWRWWPSRPLSPLTAHVRGCYDGDTCTASHILWHGEQLPPIVGRDMPVRLRGIDAPEVRGRCALESCLATRAKRLLEGFVSTHVTFRLEACVRDKYFRLTCDVISADGESASELMLQSGLAVPYRGRAKEHDWCRAIHAAHEHGCTVGPVEP